MLQYTLQLRLPLLERINSKHRMRATEELLAGETNPDWTCRLLIGWPGGSRRKKRNVKIVNFRRFFG